MVPGAGPGREAVAGPPASDSPRESCVAAHGLRAAAAGSGPRSPAGVAETRSRGAGPISGSVPPFADPVVAGAGLSGSGADGASAEPAAVPGAADGGAAGLSTAIPGAGGAFTGRAALAADAVGTVAAAGAAGAGVRGAPAFGTEGPGRSPGCPGSGLASLPAGARTRATGAETGPADASSAAFKAAVVLVASVGVTAFAALAVLAVGGDEARNSRPGAAAA